MNKFKAIIYDCDGTLVDTEQTNNQAVLDVLEECGLSGFDMAYAYQNWVGRTGEYIVASVEAARGVKLPDDFLLRQNKKARDMLPATMGHIEGALALVKELVARHIPIAVASNGEIENVVASLKVGGFDAYIPAPLILTKNMVPNAKPAPDLYIYAAGKLGLKPEECLVLEDSPTGAMAGVAAGCTVWGFNGMAHDAEKVRAGILATGAAEVFSHYNEISNALGLQIKNVAAA